MSKDIIVGSIDLPPEACNALSEFIEQLSDTFEFKNGPTATFLHLAAVLKDHIGDRK